MQKLLNRPRLLMTLCSLLLAFFFTACGTGNLTGASPTPTPTPSPTPSPTPKPSLTPYTGDGYSIGYPQGWKVSKSGAVDTFTDSSGVTPGAFLVESVANPNGGAAASTGAVNGALGALKQQGKNYQDVSMPKTTTVAGATWEQGAATTDAPLPGTTQSVNLKVVVLATTHPINDPTAKTYIIIYMGPPATFDMLDQTVFQPMLQSFKFAA